MFGMINIIYTNRDQFLFIKGGVASNSLIQTIFVTNFDLKSGRTTR